MVDSQHTKAAIDHAAEAVPGVRRPEVPAAGRQASAAGTEALSRRDLEFDLARNMRYHAAREAYLAYCSRATKALSLIIGAGAVAALVGRADQSLLAGVLTAAVVVLQMIDLVFDLPARARQHATLRQRFAALNGTLLACGDDQDKLRSLVQDLIAIYGEEPPTFSVVDAMAWNGTARSLRQNIEPADLIPITRWQRLTAHLLRRDDFDSRIARQRQTGDPAE